MKENRDHRICYSLGHGRKEIRSDVVITARHKYQAKMAFKELYPKLMLRKISPAELTNSKENQL